MCYYQNIAKVILPITLFILISYRYIYPNLQVGFYGSSNSSAYVFYAAEDVYACSAAVNIHLLRTTLHTKHRIIVFTSPDISKEYIDIFQALDVTIIEEQPIPLHNDSVPYYAGCLLKLAAFRMHEIDPTVRRILTLDSDQLILKNLDHLFRLPSTPFLAPAAYWIDKDFLTSALMLIEPNPTQWDRVREVISDPKPDQYDMDIINNLFGHLPDRLSGKYVTLNSHWEDRNLPSWFNPSHEGGNDTATSELALNQDLDNLYHHEAQVVHFTAVGKPWMFPTQELREAKKNAHPILFEQWETWRSLAAGICPGGLINQV
ncbi:hypothetical protein FOQG_18651 [Fusarium oxysporum f. sp. raphani 54005]|uniref:Glucose N-acetyltransferase 1 n=1 Tax=Fusarium oxysporum f. sp. raphani 54005 TaxID=1089458 RepID=X0B4D1_FUSOX|nr:hypothetical protein FOQG_18651 [Fusarium oxysporum f. sp. raphani 54005]